MTTSAETTTRDAPDGGTAITRHRRYRRTLIVLAVVAVAVTGVGLRMLSGSSSDAAATDSNPSGPVATAEVTRGTLADTRSFRGMLGHGEPHTVTAAGQGVVTRLAEQGTEVVAGTELFRIDEQPVTALVGAIPMFRDLGLGDTGADVAQLIGNLTDLGYADCAATDEVTSCVLAAIRAWHDERGGPDRDVVAQTDVVFVPDGARVGTLHARVGAVAGPGTPVLDLAGVDQVASLHVELRHRDLLPVGREAVVDLPGGTTVVGVVTWASVVDTDAGPGVDLEVTLAEPVDAAFLGALVDVVIEVDHRVDVLTVPVNALLALAEGGHAVEVVDADGTTTLVAVETGLFAAGRVEISGDGITEATIVATAGR